MPFLKNINNLRHRLLPFVGVLNGVPLLRRKKKIILSNNITIIFELTNTRMKRSI